MSKGSARRPENTDAVRRNWPFPGRDQHAPDDEKIHVHGLGWRHADDPITQADLHTLGWTVGGRTTQ